MTYNEVAKQWLPPQRKPVLFKRKEDAVKLLHTGKIPDHRKKAQLEVIYVKGIKRQRRDYLRLALREEGVQTREIIDINFIGKSVTTMLVPKEAKERITTSISRISGISVDLTFDPLDTGFASTLEHNRDKSPAQLFAETMKAACMRLKRQIEKLPEKRIGTKAFYQKELSMLQHREMAEPTVDHMDIAPQSDFINGQQA
jgi:hypothetical protein